MTAEAPPSDENSQHVVELADKWRLERSILTPDQLSKIIAVQNELIVELTSLEDWNFSRVNRLNTPEVSTEVFGVPRTSPDLIQHKFKRMVEIRKQLKILGELIEYCHDIKSLGSAATADIVRNTA